MLNRFTTILRGGFRGNCCAEASLGSNYFTPTWINLPDLSVCFTISPSAGIFLSTPDKLLFCVWSLGGDRPLLGSHKTSSKPHKNTAFATKTDDMRKIGIFLFACFLLFWVSVDFTKQTDQWIKPHTAEVYSSAVSFNTVLLLKDCRLQSRIPL